MSSLSVSRLIQHIKALPVRQKKETRSPFLSILFFLVDVKGHFILFYDFLFRAIIYYCCRESRFGCVSSLVLFTGNWWWWLSFFSSSSGVRSEVGIVVKVSE